MLSEIERYFNEYILPPKGYIYCDIKREIDLARAGESGGNFIAALGLLCYTEFMGKILLKNRESYTKQFKAFLRLMGEDYKQLIDTKEIDVYKIFRSGMVYSYFANDCDIKMLNDNFPSGIIIKSDGKYLFIVEKYFEDFINACQRLFHSLISEEDMVLPST
ncbi:MAG: hypothetical protein PHQ43_02865 [Dehalococcoidales bacterium]|nr:hypothetical protein [Dehalococcoidales bacterium]